MQRKCHMLSKKKPRNTTSSIMQRTPTLGDCFAEEPTTFWTVCTTPAFTSFFFAFHVGPSCTLRPSSQPPLGLPKIACAFAISGHAGKLFVSTSQDFDCKLGHGQICNWLYTYFFWQSACLHNLNLHTKKSIQKASPLCTSKNVCALFCLPAALQDTNLTYKT